MMCRAASLNAKLEPRNIDTESDKRPDIEVTNLNKGVCSLIEVSCTNPVSDTVTDKAASAPLRNANRRVYEKERKYKHLATTTKSENLQAILETTGAMSKNFRNIIKRVQELAILRTDDRGLPPTVTWAAPNFSAYWTQRIGVALANSIEAGTRRIARHVGFGTFNARQD